MMTDDQKKTLAVFESKVRQLIFLYGALKTKNAELENQLSAKNEELQLAQDKIRELNSRYDNLKIAKTLSFKQGEVKSAKQKLSKLVREIDNCIALLNE
jgi:predicted  nucleic acid-binding Zn-ribbon protein